MKYSIFSNKPAETNTPGTSGGCWLTRGHPPVVAIEEAMHYAERTGFQVIGVIRLLTSFRFHDHQGRNDHARPGQVTAVLKLRTAGYPARRRYWNSAARRPGRHRPRARGPGAGQALARYSVFTDRREAVEMYGMSVSRHLGQQTVPAG